MTMKQILYVLLAFLLVCMVTVSPVLGGVVDDEKDKITIVKGDDVQDEDQDELKNADIRDKEDVKDKEKSSSNDDESGTDIILSDDKIFGYDINDDYDITEDLSLQKAFEMYLKWDINARGI